LPYSPSYNYPEFKLFSRKRSRDIKTEIAKRHGEAVKRLRDWIGQVSIAAENRGYPEGAVVLAKLARDAGFQQATVITPTENRAYSPPGMPVHRKRSGFISCTT
jgi:hypothetical protein